MLAKNKKKGSPWMMCSFWAGKQGLGNMGRSSQSRRSAAAPLTPTPALIEAADEIIVTTLHFRGNERDVVERQELEECGCLRAPRAE